MSAFLAGLKPFRRAAIASAVFMSVLLLLDAAFFRVIGFRGGMLLLPALGLVTLTVAIFALMTFNDGEKVNPLRFTCAWFILLVVVLAVVSCLVTFTVVASLSRGIHVAVPVVFCALLGGIGQYAMVGGLFDLSPHARRLWALHLIGASLLSTGGFLLVQKMMHANVAAVIAVFLGVFAVFSARSLTGRFTVRLKRILN